MRISTKICLTILVFWMLNVVFAQFPPITNFVASNYKAGNQNWNISQSKDKSIFIANNSGLLTFNGAKWKLYDSPNGSILRSVKAIDNKVYTGSYMDFGYWEEGDFGNLIYTSLVATLQIPILEEEQFWNIVSIDQWVLFQSLNRIYIYDSEDQSFHFLDAPTDRAKIFVVDSEVFFQKKEEGLYTIDKGVSKLVFDSQLFNNEFIIDIYKENETYHIITENGFIFSVTDRESKHNKATAQKLISDVTVFSSTQLSDGRILIGTISKGIYLLEKDGTKLYHITQAEGLVNNTILTLFEDADQNIWLGTDNGISLINIKSPFKFYKDIAGKLGSVYASVVYENILYIGSNQGLFYRRFNTDDEFKLIDNTRGQVWSLKVIDAQLFCGHNLGTFIIERDKAIPVASLQGTWDIKKIPNTDLLLQGNYAGLAVLEKINGQWKLRNKLENFELSSRFFEFTGPYQIMVNHEYKGTYQLDINEDYTQVVNIEDKALKSFGSSLLKYNNEILFNSRQDIYSFDKNDNTFKKDSLLNKLIFSENDSILTNLLVEEKTGRLWGLTKNNIIYLTYSQFKDVYQTIKIPITQEISSSFVMSGFGNITHLEDNKYLLGTTTGFLVIDTQVDTNSHNRIKLDAVYANYQRKMEKLALHDIATVRPNISSLLFEFSVSNYDKLTDVAYQYKLKNVDNEWSQWTEQPYIYLYKLPHGDYDLLLRARVGNIITENEEHFNFTLQKHWYATTLMYIVYLLMFIGLVYLINHFNNKHFKKQREQLFTEQEQQLKLSALENEKKLSELQNFQLKSEINRKNRELMISSMSIVKKNEILNSIKKELIEHIKLKKSSKVIKIIDENISTKKDWEFMEKAFDDADKDFFKKLKEQHSNLTPNDFRFCAYLRQNLTSKEIAPLLNISVKSVEIKRYRLRKKLNLPHEKSLIEYILDI